MEVAAAIGLALFLWWGGTGAVLVAAGRERAGPVTVAAALVAGAAALWAFHWAAGGSAPLHAAASFGAAVAVWGWHEYAFLRGWLTGPSRAPCPPGARGWRRFSAAVLALAWHQLALLATVPLLLALGSGAGQPIGLWTFLLLFAARISAQLNVFLGVPNLSHEFVPPRLEHLKSYFRDRPINLMFPVSVTGLTFATACFAERAFAATSPGDVVGFTLVATLSALALIEHWLLVLPLRDALLWSWLLPTQDAQPTAGARRAAPDRA